ncbi:hypothetical protein [Pseudogemmobacter humi]|uniref:Uncharacterized protein n=1 Tax=Pseudogemmobacter humi TaxID=2483812 RepID=A0A3P5WH33_9RHOB|nr:hypothetical protein [Pseudogemmobacter humi]VDC22923.1 hypothetical protein XINFAN_00865 [Pseudogemmobacter humi]
MRIQPDIVRLAIACGGLLAVSVLALVLVRPDPTPARQGQGASVLPAWSLTDGTSPPDRDQIGMAVIDSMIGVPGIAEIAGGGAGGLARSLSIRHLGCVQDDRQGWNCSFTVQRRDGKHPPSERIAGNFVYEEGAWTARFSDAGGFAAMAAVQASPVHWPDPMPESLRGTWTGAGRGKFGMIELVSFRVITEGASFHLGSCRGATTTDQRTGEGSYRILIEAGCQAEMTVHIGSVGQGEMAIELEQAGHRQPLTLQRTGVHPVTASRHPDSAVDILGLPFSTAAEFQDALLALRPDAGRPRQLINGPGMLIEASTFRHRVNPFEPIGTGESVTALIFEHERKLPVERNPVVATWRMLSPAPDERPLIQEAVDGLIRKYGLPSRRNGDTELTWAFADDTGERLEGDACLRASEANFIYLSRADLRSIVNISAYIRGNRGCGITIQASLTRDEQGRLSSMLIFIQDQRLARAQSHLREIDLTRSMLQTALRRERQARSNILNL